MRKDKNMFSLARWNKGKMSQTELSDIMNVSRQTIVNWENKTFQPNASDMIKLSQELDLSIEQVVIYYKEGE